MACSRKVLQLADIPSFNMQPWNTTCLNFICFQFFRDGRKVGNTGELVVIEVRAGSSSRGELGG